MIAIGSDHGGYSFKEKIKEHFDKAGAFYEDLGTFSEESMDYPDIARDVAKKVQSKECNLGILICRSGYGMAIVANKFKGIRSVPGYNEEAVKFSRLHNDTNLLTLPADYISTESAISMIETWIHTEFEGGRHQRRVDLISQIENENMK